MNESAAKSREPNPPIPRARRLHLLRHAKSSWDDPGLADHDRPLASRGRKASGVIADYARQQGIAPSLVLCSSSVRTRETLDRLLPALGSPEVLIERAIYEGSARDLLSRLREVPDATDSVLLIGHQPAIQQLALELAAAGVELKRLRAKFPTAAMATLEFVGEWDDLGPDRAELVDYVKPKELAAGRAASGPP